MVLTPGDLDEGTHREVSSGHSTLIKGEGPNPLSKGADLRMRKRSTHQIQGKQLSLFKERELIYVPPGQSKGGTRTTGLEESSHLSLLLRNRAFTQNLLEEVVSLSNLDRAYSSVLKNQGSAGVDGMSVDELGEWLGDHLEELRGTLLLESYVPQAVLGVEIPKSNGGTRLLGVPTVLDRLIQQAIHQQLTKLYDPLMSAHSYGFRPGRSAHQAVEQASHYVSSGNRWVVDVDLEKFFDTIHHDRLMQRLSKGIGDKRLLRLIRSYLEAGMLKGGMEEQRITGTPQGGPLSPLLSNIYL